MTTTELEARLRAFLSDREWALLWEVGNSTGYAGKRKADAVAMHLWPSSGLEIHGFELKVSRSDWLRELKQPDKHAEVARYCDRWWLVVSDPEIVQPGELPLGWGLLVPAVDARHVYVEGVGGTTEEFATLKVAEKPHLRVCQQPDRPFIAAMLRAALRSTEAT